MIYSTSFACDDIMLKGGPLCEAHHVLFLILATSLESASVGDFDDPIC